MARKVLLLLALVGACAAGPINLQQDGLKTKCASFCPLNKNFGFEDGKTYEYSYESDVKTHIPGATEEHSSLHMRATVRLEVLSRCEMALQLSDVRLQDSNPGDETRKNNVVRTAEFRAALEKNALRFAFISGHVEAVCPSESDDTWVLNVKRAILSTMQNGMNEFQTDFRSRESDVTGECPVQYQAMGSDWNGVHTIKKVKDLEGCTNRHNADTVFQGTAYRTPSRMQSLPAMKGTHECEQKINRRGILTESSCSESHIFRPFSRRDSGATTEVRVKLTFTSEIDGVSSSEGLIHASKGMLFEHDLSVEESRLASQEAEESLRQLCVHTIPDVQRQAPAMFGQLVRHLRQLDSAGLLALHRNVRRGGYCPNAEKYLHDAIPTIGSVASARLIKDLIMSGEVAGAEEAIWINSLSFIQNPNAGILAEVTPLIKTEPLRRQAALAVSSLVNNFCRENTRCGSTKEVRAIVEVFTANLAGGCAGNHDKVLMSLKALGNTGHAETAVPSLNSCLDNERIPMDIRVAAVQAFRRMACTADRSTLTTLFENSEIDSELRINAYLALMSCPTEDVIRRVRLVLEREEINQVGSFVWTHLTNLMESSSPMKQEIRHILDSESLRKEFDLDKRKFSRNIEWSTFSDTFNSGASVDSNVIWSEKSFVPRAASVNLTVDLFGHSVNLVEVGGRVEGLNQVLEKVFDTNTPSDDSKSSNRDINKIDAKYGAKKEELRGSGYVRIFGNEIAYADLDNLDISTLKEKFNYLNWLAELAKERDVEFSKSFQFMDTSLNIPTIAGFPLRLHIEGNAVTDIKMKGKFDVRSFLASPRSISIDGSIAPSAAVEVSAQMGVYTFGARTGVITVNTLHTSTMADGKIEFKEGKMVNIDLNMPKDTMEIFEAQHKFYVVHRESTREQQMKGQRVEYSRCLGNAFSKVTGVDLCGRATFPSTLSSPGGPWAPFASPASVSLALNKKDIFTKYHFEASVSTASMKDKDHTDVVDFFKVSFDTPGSRIDRELTIDMNWNRAHEAMLLNLRSPWKKVELRGALVRNDDLKRLSASAIIDDDSRYSLTAELQTEKNTYNTRYTPLIELSIPDRDPITFTGSLLYRPMKKVDVDLRLENAFRRPVTAKGYVTIMSKKGRQRLETSIDIKSTMLTSKVEGFIDRTTSSAHVYTSRLEVQYALSNSDQERITFSNKLRDSSTNIKKEYSLASSFSTTMWPKWNFEVSSDLALDDTSMSSSFEAFMSGNKRKAISITQTGTLSILGSTKTATLGITYFCPFKRIPYEVKMDFEYQPQKLKSSATFKSGDRQLGLLDVDMEKKDSSSRMDVKLHYPGREMALHAEKQKRNNGQRHYEASLQLEKGQVVNMISDYKKNEGHELTTDITTPFTDPLRLYGFIKPEISDFEAKAGVVYSDQQYNVVSAFSYNGNQKQFRTTSSLQLTYPSRNIKVDASLIRKWKNFKASIQTQWAENRQVSLTADLTASLSAPSFTLRAEWPNRFAELSTSGKLVPTSTWTSMPSHLEVDVNFRSSFKSIEKVAAILKYDRSAAQITTSASASWAPEKKIVAVVNLDRTDGYSSVDFSAKLTTPFEPVRRAIYTLTYTKSGNTVTLNTKAQLNARKISLGLTGSADLPNIDVKVTLTTPLRRYKDLTLTAKHAYDGRVWQSEAEFTWAPDKKIAMEANAQISLNGRHYTNSGVVKVTTPFGLYRTTQYTWDHDFNKGAVKAHGELDFKNAKSIWDVNAGSLTEDNDRRSWFKFANTGPYTDILIDANHHYNRYDLRNMKSSATFQWTTGKLITINNDFSFDGKSFRESLKLTGPFKPITLDMTNRLVSKTFTGNNELRWGENMRIAVEAAITVDGAEVDGSAQISTPFFDIQKMVFNNKFEDGLWVSSGKYEYAAGRSMEATTKVGFGRTKRLFAEFKSECAYLKSTYIDLTHTGKIRDFNTRLEIFHHLLQDNIRFNGLVDVPSIKDIKVNLKLITPFRGIRTLRTSLGHKHVDRNTISSSGSFQWMKYKAGFSNELKFTSWKHFNTKTVVQYTPGEKIQFTTDFQASNIIMGKATLQSPFTGLEDLAVTFTHEGHLSNFKTNAELSLDNTRKISGGMEFVGTLPIKVLAYATTPYVGYKSMGFTFNLDGQPNNFQQDWSVYLEKIRIAGETVSRIRNGEVNIKSTMQTPFDGYENILLTFSHSGGLYDFSHTALFEYPDNRFRMSNSVNLAGRRLTAISSIETPFWRMKKFNVEVLHEGSIKNFRNTVTVLINDVKYEAGSNFQSNDVTTHGNIYFKGPEEYSITFTHNGQMTNFNNEMNIKFNGRNIKGETKFKLSGSNLEASAMLLTPFQGYEKFLIDISHHGPPTNFQCEHRVEAFGHQITISDKFRKTSGALKGLFKLTSTFKEVQSFIASVNHKGSLSNFQNSGFIAVNGEKYVGSSEFRLAGNKISGSASILIPEEYSLTFTHNGQMSDFNNDLKIKFNGRNINGETKFKLSGSTLEASAMLLTPFQGYERFSVEISHHGPPTNFQCEHTIEAFGHRITISDQFRKSPSELTGLFKLTSTFKEVQSFIASVNHKGSLSNFQNSGFIAVNGEKYVGSSEFRLAGNKISGSASILIPEEYSLTFTHNGQMSDFNNDLKIKFNGRNMNGETKFKLSGSTLEASAMLLTPFQGYERFSVEISHHGPPTNFQCEHTIEAFGHRITISDQFRKSPSELTGLFKLTSTFREMQSFIVSFNHKGSLSNFQNRGFIDVNGDKYVGSSEFRLSGDMIRGSASILIPEEYSLTFTHNGQMSDFNNDLKIKFNGRNINGETKFKLSGSTLEASAMLLTPFRGYEKFLIEISHHGPPTNFQCEHKVEAFGHRITISDKFRKTSDALTGLFKLTSTFKQTQSFIISFNHKGSLNNFQNSGFVALNADKYVGSSEFSIQGDKVSGRATVLIPEEYSVAFNHEGPVTDFENDLTLKMADKTFSVENKLKLSETGFKVSVTAVTPFPSPKTFEMKFTHEGPLDDFRQEGTFKNGNDLYFISNVFEGRGNLKASLKLTTPHSQLRNLNIDINHRGKKNNFKNNIDVLLNDRKYQGNSEFKLFRTNLKASASVTLTEEYSILLVHKGGLTDFGNTLQINMAGQKINMNSAFTKTDDKINAVLNIITPFDSFERTTMKFTHEGPLENFKTSAQLLTSVSEYRNFAFDASFGRKADGFEAYGKLIAPFLRNVEVNANHRGTLRDFASDVTINHNRQTLKGTITFRATTQNIQSTGSLETSFRGFEKFVYAFNHNGNLNDFTTTLRLETPFQKWSVVQGNVIHKGTVHNFASSAYADISGDRIGGKVTFKNADKIEGSVTIETPFPNMEKFEATLQLAITEGSLRYSGTLTTPFKDWASMGFELTHQGSLRNFQTSLVVNAHEKSAKANIKHRYMDGISTTGSFEFDKHRLNVGVTLEQAADATDFTASLETSRPGDTNRFAVAFHHEKTSDGFTTTGSIDHPSRKYAKPSFQVDLKKTPSLFKLNGMITTPIKEVDPIIMHITCKNEMNDFTLTSSLDGYGHKINVNIAVTYGYRNGEGESQATGALTTTFPGYERFSFAFRNRKRVGNCVTMGNIELPFERYNNPSFEVTLVSTQERGSISAVVTTPFKSVSPLTLSLTNNIGSPKKDLSVSGSFEVNRRRFTFKTDLKRSSTKAEISGSIETPYKVFDRFGFKAILLKSTGLQKMNLALEIPFKNYQNPSVIFERRDENGVWSTMFRVITPFTSIDEVILNLQHQGDLRNFKGKMTAEYGNSKGEAKVNFENIRGNIALSASLETPFNKFDRFSLAITHKKNANGFSTSGRLETPFKSYENPAFELTHEGNTNNFRSSLKLTTPWKDLTPITANIDHRGQLNDFVSNGALEFNGQRISLNGAFEKVRANMKISAVLETTFRNLERFALILNHNNNGKVIRTIGNIDIPFRGYAKPSFEFEHRGGLEDFSTKGKLVTPFKQVDPITFAINHKGPLKDCESIANIQYNGQTISGQGSFKTVNGKITASGLLKTPFRNAERFGFTLDHQNDGRQIKTKATIETPHSQYRNFGLEISHHGHLKNFVLVGKVDTPFSTMTTVNFRLSHRGTLSDFKSAGFVETGGKKLEAEAEYKKTQGWYEADHEGRLMVATPFSILRQAEVNFNQGHSNGDWTGNLKGSYNSHEFDTDYMFTNKANKAVKLTVRQPRSMLIKTTINPSKATADGLFQWDTTSIYKRIRFEGGLKNEVKGGTTDREVSLKVYLPSRTLGVTTGYELSQGKINHKAHVQWDNGRENMLNYEIELSKDLKSRPHFYGGHLKLSSPFANFETSAQHRVNPGRRYLTQIDIITQERLTIRSDITPTMPDFRASVTINHPHFSKDIVFAFEGKMEPEKLNYDGKIDVQYGTQKMEFTGKIADKSDSSQMRYIAEASMKHPESQFDFSFKSDVGSSTDALTGNMEITYLMARDRLMKTLSLRTEINKLREELNFQVLTPMKLIKLKGRRTMKDATRQHFTVAGTVDERSLSAEIDLDRTLPSFGMAVNYAPESSLHLYGKYLNHNNVKFEAYRQEVGTRTTETELNLELEDGHLLKARAFIRPGLLHDFLGLFQEGSSLLSFISEVTSVLEDEFMLRLRTLTRAVEPISRGFKDLYNHNDYYFKDLTRAVVDAADSVVQQLRPVVYSATALAGEYFGKLQKVMADTYQRTSQRVAKLSEQAQELASHHLSNIHGSLYDVVDNIRRNPRTENLLNVIQSKMERVVARISDLADMAKETVERIWSKPELKPLRNWITKVSQKSVRLYDYLQLEENARAFLHHLRETGFGPLRNAAWKTARTYLHLEETSINTWIPERGEFSGQIYIPFILQDLRSRPTINVRQYIDTIKSYLPDTDWVIWDTFYAYKPRAVNIKDWIPPFETHATLAGMQHYMTFDRRFYDFSGECSYLLARDFLDGTFSVVVNYDIKKSGTKKSLTVIHGKTQVEIKPEFRVELNGRRTELPITTEHTAIYRVGNTLRVDNDHGVTIVCDLPHDRCTVSVSGWYFGKTAGLLGTYDNEPATDFTTSTGSRATSPEALADSWTVGRRCVAVNHAVSSEPSPSSPNYEKCASYFKSNSSPFRPCFKQIEPATFMTMCGNDDPCNSAAFYIDECSRKGVPIRMPADCVKCKMPDGQLMTEDDEPITIEGDDVPQEADIIFVLSHGSCNKATMEKLPDIANNIGKGLRAAGIKKTHFGLVAYGGNGKEAQPHSHTLDGQLINTKTAFLQSLRTFTTTGKDSGDETFSAVELATTYPFHAGASKTIVLVPCADCSEQGVMYSDLQAALLNNNIRLHILLQHDFQLKSKSKSPKTSYLFGLDRDGAYTTKHVGVSDLKGDRDLRRQMAIPKDLCVALTHETDGAVFNLLKLIKGRQFIQKRFLDVMGRVLAKKGTPAECQICECHADETGTGMTACHSCEPPMDWASFGAQDLPKVPVPLNKPQKKTKRRN